MLFGAEISHEWCQVLNICYESGVMYIHIQKTFRQKKKDSVVPLTQTSWKAEKRFEITRTQDKEVGVGFHLFQSQCPYAVSKIKLTKIKMVHYSSKTKHFFICHTRTTNRAKKFKSYASCLLTIFFSLEMYSSLQC